MILGLAIFVELRLVTDGQTDGQTDRHTMTAYTALAQHRAVKTNIYYNVRPSPTHMLILRISARSGVEVRLIRCQQWCIQPGATKAQTHIKCKKILISSHHGWRI